MSTSVTPQDRKQKDFPAMLKAFLPEIQRALPTHLNGDRMSRIALTAFRRTPKLAECDPSSVFAAVIQAAQLGLEPDTLGRAYLLPYAKNKKVGNVWEKTWECQFIPGWKGLVDLVSRSGQATVWTGAVFAGDKFDYQLGDDPKCTHIPGEMHGEGEPTHVYACGKVKGSDTAITEVWSIARVKRHLQKYNKVGDKHYAYENMEMYARKVVLLQVLKYMPMSTELSRAVELDNAAVTGSQGLNVNDAIAGEWIPVNEDEQEVPSTPEVKTKPAYTDDQIHKNLDAWGKLIAAGKKTTDDIIATIESKHVMTIDQKAMIDKLAEQINRVTIDTSEDNSEFLAAMEAAE
jgi:recombination protein RecT